MEKTVSTVTLILEGWEYKIHVDINSTPKILLSQLWTMLYKMKQPKRMPNGSFQWTNCENFCPSESEKHNYKIMTSTGKILEHTKPLFESGITDKYILFAKN